VKKRYASAIASVLRLHFCLVTKSWPANEKYESANSGFFSNAISF